MIFRQLYDHESSTYTYLLAERNGGEVLLIDPVQSHTKQYVQLVEDGHNSAPKPGLRSETGCLNLHDNRGDN